MSLNPTPNWQNILWREWRHSEDAEYAGHLFNLVADEPVGWRGITGVAALSTLYGQLAGLLLWLLVTNYPGGLSPHLGHIVWLVLLGRNNIPSPVNEVVPNPGHAALLVLLGGLLSGIITTLFSWERLSWRTWLAWLTPTTYLGRIGKSSLTDSEWLLGLIIGLSGLGIIVAAPVGVLVAIYLGRKYEVKLDTNEHELGSLAGGLTAVLGAIVGGMVAWGGALGGIVGFILGLGMGIYWGCGLIGLFIGGVGLLAGWLFLGIDQDLIGWLALAIGYGLGVTENTLTFRVCLIEPYLYRTWYGWWREQPPLSKVANALHRAIETHPQAHPLWIGLLSQLNQIEERPGPINGLIRMLLKPNWVDRFKARYALITWGGEAAPLLGQISAETGHPLQSIARWLLTGIELDTTNRLSWRLSSLLCPNCLTRFNRHQVNLPWPITYTYYGCHQCNQSRNFLEWIDQVIAVLDTAWPDSHTYQDGQLRVNWLTRRELFDFDRVEIVQATDEEAERLAVQVGNDTDPVRKPRYRQISCTIGPECHLSENTRRILQRTFGEVITHADNL